MDIEESNNIISLSDIFEYIVSVRPVKEGEAVFNAGHVTLCGIKDSSDLETIIVGRCMQTSDMHAKPHNIEIKLKEKVEDWTAQCSCKAGLGGKCKHIVAVMIYVNRTKSLEKLSCTDLEQTWGSSGPRPGTSTDNLQYNIPLKMVDYCHPEKKKNKLVPNDGLMADISNTNFEILSTCDESLAIGKFLAGRNDNIANDEPNWEEFSKFDLFENLFNKKNHVLDAISISNDIKTKFYIENIENVDAKIIYEKTLEQIGPEWHQARKFRITGSTCYSFYTYSKNKNPDWDNRLFNFFHSTFSGNVGTVHGVEQESKAREAYAHAFQKNVKKCGFIVNKKVPWLGFSPDGIAENKILLEIKCPLAGKTKSIEDIIDTLPYVNKEDHEYYLKKKHSYYGQVQLGMLLLNLEECDFIIYSSLDNSLHVINVKIDYGFCKNLIMHLKDVYFYKILPYIENNEIQ